MFFRTKHQNTKLHSFCDCLPLAFSHMAGMLAAGQYEGIRVKVLYWAPAEVQSTKKTAS